MKVLSKGESLAITCFVAGLRETDAAKSAAALLELVDYVRELEYVRTLWREKNSKEQAQ